MISPLWCASSLLFFPSIVTMSHPNGFCFGCDPILLALWTQHFAIVKRQLVMDRIKEVVDGMHEGTSKQVGTQDRHEPRCICVPFCSRQTSPLGELVPSIFFFSVHMHFVSNL